MQQLPECLDAKGVESDNAELSLRSNHYYSNSGTV